MSSFSAILHAGQSDKLGLLAFVVAVFATPLAMRVALRFGVLDLPDRKLKPHAKPIPYLGGTAICAAWGLALIAAMVSGTCDWRIMLPLLLGGVGMSVLGLIDDIWTVPPKIRLLVGTAIIAAVIVSTGAGFQLVGSSVDGVNDVLASIGIHLPAAVTTAMAFVAVPLSVLIAIVIVLGACNSANLIEVGDGALAD